LNCDLAYQLHI